MIRTFNNASSRTIAKRIVSFSRDNFGSSSGSSSRFRSFVSLNSRVGGGSLDVNEKQKRAQTHQGLEQWKMQMTSASSYHTMNMNRNNNLDLTTSTFTSKRSFWSRSKSTPNATNDDTAAIPSSSSPSSSSPSETTPEITNDATTQISFSPEEEMAKFEQTASTTPTPTTTAVEGATTTAETSTTVTSIPWESTWWPHDQMLDFIVYTHDLSGLNYAITIGAITIAFRTALVPLFISAQRNSSRMGHVKPELDVLKAKVDNLDPNDLQGQQKYAKEMQALFKKFDVNPLKALSLPLIQMPVFMSMFFALKKMPDVYPEKLVDGGILWFMDLNAPDPYYVLPALSGLTFVVMMELGKEQMLANAPEQGQLMLNFFRGMALLIVPVATTFPTAVLCYWTANNTFSLLQSVAFQQDSVRKMCGIWKPPKPVPGAPKQKGMVEMFQETLAKQRKDQEQSVKERIEMHNAAIDKNKRSNNTNSSVGSASNSNNGTGRKRNTGRRRSKK